MTRKQRRLGILLAALVCVGAATALTLGTFHSNLVFFLNPNQITAKEAPVVQVFQLGGLIERGSIQRECDDMTIRFIVTDTAHEMSVICRDLLSDLFREGKDMVARGRLGEDDVFVANKMFAKHDGDCTPLEATDAVRRTAQVKEQMAEGSARDASR